MAADGRVLVEFARRRRMVLCGAAVTSLTAVAVSFLVALLGHPVLRSSMWDGGGVVGWACAIVLSFCFMAAVVLVHAHCLMDRGWFWPGWAAGLVYTSVLVAGFDAQQSPTIVRCFSLYMTSIPFQLALLARRLSARVPARPLGPGHRAGDEAAPAVERRLSTR
ncbi:MAG: hypothetical protein ABIS86_02140 [Streptosporangiaceae bacterium]